MFENTHPKQDNTKSNVTKESSLHYIETTIRGMLTLLMIALLASCGDLVNHPEEPEQRPPHSEPKPETPQTPQKPIEKPSTKEAYDRMCEEERQWAYRVGLIDLNQLRLYQSRNFAPVFNTPGERQSGIDGFVVCQRALEINGFINHSDRED